MPQTKHHRTKPDRKPKTNTTHPKAEEQISSAQQSSAEPAKRWDDLRDRATKTLRQYPEFAGLEDLDLMCVLALVELLSYGGHNIETMNDAPNWVGAFVTEVLFEVARSGPASVNARPGDVKYFFDRAVENLRDTMSLCQSISSAIPQSAFDEIENWTAADKATAAGAV